MSNSKLNERPLGGGEQATQASPSNEAAETAANPDEGLGNLQADLERFRDLALRSQADFENYRKRSLREKEEAVKYANASVLERLIPIIDNFELGLNAARNSPDAAAIITGLDMVARQLSDFLTQHGVEAILAEGKQFDPNQHEAVAQEASADVPEGRIIRQMRKGFRMRDRLLRPASVVVSKGAEPVS